MVTVPKKAVSQDTKEKIIEVASRLFSEFTYLGVSMDYIAKDLGITKAALYYHFKSKEDLYIQVLDAAFEKLNSVIPKTSDKKTPEKKLHELVKNYLDFGFKEKNLVKTMVSKLSITDLKITKHIDSKIKKIAESIRPIIEEVVASQENSSKHDPDSALLTLMLIWMMNGLILDHSFSRRKIDAEKISNQIIVVLF